jgi:multidrug efflux pump subunit AcrA (membrane-fusion protein)
MAIEQNNPRNDSLLRSKEIDDVIGEPPHWLIRWGISIFLSILLLVFGLSYFIRYPETINVPFKLVSANPSVPVSINENALIIKLNKKDGSFVHKNDTLFFWKGANNAKQNVFKSPSDGKISFFTPLFDGQRIEKEQFLFFINPSSSNFYAELYVNSSSIGQIKPGQQIRLKLQEYPDFKYGFLNGSVDYISKIKTPNGYYVRATLPQGLRTTKNRPLTFTNGLSGTAEIIINKKRLLDKFMANKKSF